MCTSKNICYQPSFSTLSLTQANVLRMVGSSDEVSLKQMKNDLNEIFEKAIILCHPTCTIAIFDLESIATEKDRIFLNGFFSVGEKIASYLKGSQQIAVFVCTIGKEMEEWARELLTQGDFLKAYLVDILGSLSVEKAMDFAQNLLKKSLLEKGLKITNRYSPGYCDWNVAEQQKLFNLLPGDYEDVILSESSLMTPMKSVSGFIGIGQEVQFKKVRCADCSSKNCAYRAKK